MAAPPGRPTGHPGVAAVVNLATRPVTWHLSGHFAWLFAQVHFLIGFRNRTVVLIDWASACFSFQRQASVVAGGELPDPAPDA